MIENVEINYGTACEILADENSDKKQLRVARATIASMAEQGHREAIAKVLSRPGDYDLDMEEAIDSLPDVKERAYMFNRLCDYYNGRDRGKLKKFALKSLENGKIVYTDYNDPEILIPILEKMDPKDYDLEGITNAMRCYKRAESTDNKWSECFLDTVASDPKTSLSLKWFWYNTGRFLDFDQRKSLESIIRGYLDKNGIEDLKFSELENIHYFIEAGHLSDYSKTIGIKLLSLGKDSYLESMEIAEKLVGYGSEITDKDLFKELEKASSKEKIYARLASNFYITEKGRICFAEKALELGSNDARKRLAVMVQREHPLKAMRLYLECEQDWGVRSGIVECYERLSGSQPGDLMALELYRAYRINKDIDPDTMEELKRRFAE